MGLHLTQKALQELPITNLIDSVFPQGWRTKCAVMAIVNITPDSFSDGGEFLDLNSSLQKVSECIRDGADIIDLGAQSTRPGALDIGCDEELKRLIPLIRSIRSNFPKIILSVDTFQPKVAKEVLNIGVNWINDVTGGRFDNEIFKVVADFECPYVLTHSRGDSRTMLQLTRYKDLVNDVIDELKKQTDIAISRGVDPSRIIWDPGLGFAKNTVQNLQILRNLDQFKNRNYPLLIGASRKRFIGETLKIKDPKERIFGNAAVVARCVSAQIDIVRTHEVKEMVQVVQMSESIF